MSAKFRRGMPPCLQGGTLPSEKECLVRLVHLRLKGWPELCADCPREKELAPKSEEPGEPVLENQSDQEVLEMSEEKRRRRPRKQQITVGQVVRVRRGQGREKGDRYPGRVGVVVERVDDKDLWRVRLQADTQKKETVQVFRAEHLEILKEGES